MRDTKVLESYVKESEKKAKEMKLFKELKKEVDAGANGTQKYVIKEGINKGMTICRIVIFNNFHCSRATDHNVSNI